MPGGSPRRLVLIPVVHSLADLGSLGRVVQELYASRFGPKTWARRVRTVEDFWTRIRGEIEGLGLDYSRVRLYQDGLPNCGHEAAIVRDMAHAGSQNHQLLALLMARGARIVGTESPELLLEEYELMRGILGGLSAGAARGLSSRERQLSRGLLRRRDCYIAERIAHTLGTGETGLLFLGLLHCLEEHLASDILVRRIFAADTTGDPHGQEGQG